MMQLGVYLDAGHRALGKWKRDSCRLNYLLHRNWFTFGVTAICGDDAGCGKHQPWRAMLLLFVQASNSSTPLAIATLAYQSSYRIAVICDLYECS